MIFCVLFYSKETNFRFNLHTNWPMTAFILNLAFADFFVCGFNIFQHVYQSSNPIICIIIDNLGYSNEYSEFMSLAMLAAFRCLSVIYPGKASIMSYGTNRIMVFILIRIYSLLLLIPYNFDVSKCYYRALLINTR